VEHVASDAGHVVSDATHAVGSDLSSIAHTVENGASSPFTTVLGGAHNILNLGLHEGAAIGSAVGHSFYNMA
jgi:hypothetical protein